MTDDAPPLRVLLVEDNPDDAELAVRTLREAGLAIESQVAASESELRAALADFAPGLALVDWSVPGFSGAAAVTIIRESDASIPIILVSGTVMEMLVTDALRVRATDYVSKRNLAALAPAVQRALAEAAQRREREALEVELAASAALLRGSLEAMIDPFAIVTAVRDDAGRIIDLRIDYYNQAARTWAGVTEEQVRGATAVSVHPGLVPSGLFDAFNEVIENDEPLVLSAFPYADVLASGRAVGGAYDIQAVKFGDGVMVIWRDVTEREAARRERERLASIVEQSRDGILVAEVPDDRVAYANAAFAEDLGLTPPDLAGRSVLEVVDGVLDAPTIATLLDVTRAGRPWLGEAERRLADGRVGPVQIRVTPRRAADGTLEGYVVVSRDVGELRASEAALASAHAELARSLSLLTSILDGTVDHIFAKDLDGRYLLANRADADWFGLPKEEIIGRTDADLVGPQEAAGYWQIDRMVLESGTLVTYEQEATRDGVTRTWQTTKNVIHDASGHISGLLAIAHEITEQRRQEAQLRQAAKMEAIGQLAGGVAHDFNNMLTAIRGYTELVVRALPSSDEQDRADLGQVIRAADRAAGLTRQLLAFARQQVLIPLVLDPGEAVAGIVPMLRRLLGEHIAVTTHSAPGPGQIRVDPTQLEQVILNLAVNARDAMPTGGQLTIETANVDLDAAYAAAHPGSSAGPHVMLAVSDTGTGMDQATRDHIFEPFFTTKPAGQGTGMGLATVYGIVKQSGGSIYVYSEPGHGTTFRLYFPRAFGASEADPQPAAPEGTPTGRETILLTEDDPGVRGFTARSLANLGYTVLEAGDGAEALAVAAAHPGVIDLLVTDMIMPGMHGAVLAERLTAVRPGLRTLYVSGFTEDSVIHHGLVGDDVAYLPKPFSGEALGRAVRAVLDGRPVR